MVNTCAGGSASYSQLQSFGVVARQSVLWDLAGTTPVLCSDPALPLPCHRWALRSISGMCKFCGPGNACSATVTCTAITTANFELSQGHACPLCLERTTLIGLYNKWSTSGW
jgi:hypothetical protein